jgi:hypothetical protein
LDVLTKESQHRKVGTRVQLKTILKRVQKFKSFVYGTVWWEEIGGVKALLVEVLPRRNSRPVCSGCGRAGPGYDTLETADKRFKQALTSTAGRVDVVV